MKNISNTISKSRKLYIVRAAITFFAAAVTAYGFTISNEMGSHWLSTLCIICSMDTVFCPLEKANQNKSLIAAFAATAIAAVIVFARVGTMIFNIRYIGLVLAVCIAALAASLIAFSAKEIKEGKDVPVCG